METLRCRYGGESVKRLQFTGQGRYDICIVRTSAMTEHVEGLISLKKVTGQKLLKRVYRSDKGGFHQVVNVCDDDVYELKVTGSAHSFASGLFGCADSDILITITGGLGTQNVPTQSQLSFSLMETQIGLSALYPGEMQSGIHAARTRSQADLSDCIQRINSPNRPTQTSSNNAVPHERVEKYAFDFIATSLAELVELLEKNFAAASITDVQSGRMLITDAAGIRVDDWPENDAAFPLRFRYTCEDLCAHEPINFMHASQGFGVAASQAKAGKLLRSLGLRTHDMGVRNVDERGRSIYNQCFYLSLARGWLGHTASQRQVQDVALKLKRSIEAAVIAERPHWQKEVGEEAQAFADFLPVAMRARNVSNILAELAVCIIDSSTGQAQVYMGPMYKQLHDSHVQQRNMIMLWYTPGHYKCVVNDDSRGSKIMMTYLDFRNLLLHNDIAFIETFE